MLLAETATWPTALMTGDGVGGAKWRINADEGAEKKAGKSC